MYQLHSMHWNRVTLCNIIPMTIQRKVSQNHVCFFCYTYLFHIICHAFVALAIFMPLPHLSHLSFPLNMCKRVSVRQLLTLHQWEITHFKPPGHECNVMEGDQKVSVHLTITVQQSPNFWWFKDGHHRIHSECGLCYTKHGLREHSSACQ